MKNRIITISREFGSGGRTIGKLLEEKLSINCYDNQIINRIAQESGFSKEYVNTQSETAPQSLILANPFFYNYTYSTNQDYMWNIQRKIILELAEKESCIIVGRLCRLYPKRYRRLSNSVYPCRYAKTFQKNS